MLFGKSRWVGLESLENRRLFSSPDQGVPEPHTLACGCAGCCRPVQAGLTASALSASVSRFALRINFGPLGIERVRGHKTDYGARYSQRGNGLQYGWNYDHRDQAVYNDSPTFDNLRAETNIRMQNNSTWSIKVPNGWYEVRVLMGDPDVFNADYRLNAEGKPVVKGQPFSPSHPFVEGMATIQVTDGKLTLSSDSQAIGNRLAAVGITQVSAPVSAVQGTKISWSTASVRSPLHRAEAGSVRVGDKLYIFGGFRSQYYEVTGRVDILDLNTHTWTKARPLPGAQTHFGITTDGRYIYLAGGQYGPMLSTRGTAEVWRYDTQTDTWASLPPLPAIRFGGQMQYLNGRLHFVGGNDSSRVRARSEHWIFDLSKPQKGWYAGATLPMATDHHSSIVVKNNLYVLGGEVEHGTSYLPNAGFYRYDADANRWITLPNMPVPTSHVEAATLTDGVRIFIIAGQTHAQQLTSDVYSFDFKRNRWVQHTSLPTARKAGIAWIMGNKLFYMTGDDAKYGEPRSTYVGVIG